MALAARSTTLSGEMSRCMFAPQTKGIAGADLAAGDTVYMKQSDGQLYPADGTAANEAATFWGITLKSYKSGESATAFGIGAKISGYLSTALNIGVKLFVAATAGRLDTAATTGGTTAVARVVGSPNSNGSGQSTDIEVVVQFT